ncbi:MAG: replication initiator protein A [Gemmataceae bacterium]|nr:replication initiator protein A [Gemmataceae bacterium]
MELIRNGRDELNLAEFPLSLIGDCPPKGIRMLVFEDRIRDQATGEVVTRRLTVSPSDQHGLPTAIDEDVLVALVALTRKANGFTNRVVPFTRYQLLRLLDWPDKGQSYRRLEESLKRWVGVTLYYEKAWWDKAEQAWVDEHFHIIDNVSIYDLEARRRKQRRTGQVELPLSTFAWNDVIFQSFQAENLKKLDLRVYFGLRLAPARRMYRFLDKRFYRRGRWQFDLREFACEHVGFSRTYDNAQLRRKMQPAVEELEAAGVLEPLALTERYLQVRRGEWKVLFIRKQEPPAVAPATKLLQAVKAELVQRGVTPATAAELVDAHSVERLRTKLEVFDWLAENRDPRLSKNPAGYLVQSIRDDYVPPKGFEPAAEREAKKRATEERRARQQEAQARRVAEEEAKRAAERAPVELYWNALTPDQQRELEAEAVRTADPWVREKLAQPKAGEKPSALADAYRKAAVERLIRRLLLGDDPRK